MFNEQREEARRNNAVRQLIERGKTREEAEAFYDRPLGTCCKCGSASKGPKSRLCRLCSMRSNNTRVRTITARRREEIRYRAAVAHHIRRGKSREEAEAFCGRPKGICAQCGNPANSANGRICNDCLRREARLKAANNIQTRRCEKCGVEFLGRPRRKFCDLHGYSSGRSKPREPKPPKPPPSKTPRIIPGKWEDHAQLDPAQMRPPEVIICPPHIHVIRIQTPSNLAGLRDLFGTGKNAAD